MHAVTTTAATFSTTGSAVVDPAAVDLAGTISIDITASLAAATAPASTS